MAFDPQFHLRIARPRGSDKDHAPRCRGDSLRETNLSTAYAAKHEGHLIRVGFLHAVAFNLSGTNWGDSKDRNGPERRSSTLPSKSIKAVDVLLVGLLTYASSDLSCLP